MMVIDSEAALYEDLKVWSIERWNREAEGIMKVWATESQFQAGRGIGGGDIIGEELRQFLMPAG